MLGYWVLFAVVLYRGGIIIPVLLGYRVMDFSMFTYIDYVVVTVNYALLLYSMRELPIFKVFIMYLLPIVIGTTISVTISIVVILQSNGGELLLRSTALNGGTHSLGTVHTAHFILHFLTTIDLLLVLLFNWSFIKANYRPTFLAMSNRQRVWHALWFFLSALVVLSFYMLNFNFIDNYPVHMHPWQSVLVQAIVSIAIGVLFWLSLVIGDHDEKKTNRTPIHKWTTVL